MEAAKGLVVRELKIKSADHGGLKRSELKVHTGLNSEIFDFVIENLSREQQLQVQGELVSLVGSDQHLAEADRNALSAIAAAYEGGGLAAPSASEVANNLLLNETEMRRLMTLLLREKILVKMGSENIFIHSIALSKLRAELLEMRGQKIDVARFKQITGVSRKYAIPLLEYLDRERVTRKEGDVRLIL